MYRDMKNAVSAVPLRLIVAACNWNVYCNATGETQLSLEREKVGMMVAHHILKLSGVEKEDVIDPQLPTNFQKSKLFAPGRKHDTAHLRGTNFWGRSNLLHFDGVWCDRILFGQDLVRTAILIPQMPAQFNGEALAKVLQTHQHLDIDDVVLLLDDPESELGTVNMRCGSPPLLHPAAASCVRALERFFPQDLVTKEVPQLHLGTRGEGPTFDLRDQSILELASIPVACRALAQWASTKKAPAIDVPFPSAALKETWAKDIRSMIPFRDEVLVQEFHRRSDPEFVEDVNRRPVPLGLLRNLEDRAGGIYEKHIREKKYGR